jgi:hypothetical protein
MVKTVESYRTALEQEIIRWDGFARALRKEDLKAFEELMDMCRSLAPQSSNAKTLFMFEPMIMSILVAQQRKLQELHYKLYELLRQEISAHERQTQPQKASQQPLPVPEMHNQR